VGKTVEIREVRGALCSTLRHKMLDISAAKGVVAPRTATMVRMQIQPIHRPKPSQRDGQLKLCVPPMTLTGDSYRTRQRRELLAKENRTNRD
jgi:hypothetical protein